MSLTNCRFYEEKYPEIDSFVMVNVSLTCPFERSETPLTTRQVKQVSLHPLHSLTLTVLNYKYR